MDDSSSNAPIASPSISTLYIVQVMNSFNCYGEDSVMVTISPKAFAGNDTSICIGESMQLQSNAGLSFAWSPAIDLNDSTLINPLATPAITTQYFLTRSDSIGCITMDSMWVMVNDLPIANAGEDTILCKNQTTQLQASGGVNYQWSPATGLDNASISNPTANPTITTTYTVTVTDINGCVNQDQVLVTRDTCAGIETLNNNQQVKIYPNPFSNTTTIEIVSEQNITNLFFVLYDLLGREVKSIRIESKKQTLTSKHLQPGLYFWKMGTESGKLAVSEK